MEELVRGRNVALGLATEASSIATYTSHLNSYVAFCTMHNLPLDPTPDTLSFYVVYMSHHIEPRSVGTYLSGICDRLEVYFPDVRKNRESLLVKKVLIGMKKLRSKPICRKQPLTCEHLLRAQNSLTSPPHYDDLLFVTMLITGTCGLLRLGELTVPDNARIRDLRKVTQRSSVEFTNLGYSFWIPYHKADRLFEGNKVVIKSLWGLRSMDIFRAYLSMRDTRFPLHPHLWVTSANTSPTRKWFMSRLRRLEPDSHWAGQSMRAGGATALAEDGMPLHLIQASGRWSSETFNIYIQENPIVLSAILAARRNES